MSERDDTAKLIKELKSLAEDLYWDPQAYGDDLVAKAANKIQELNDRLTAIDNANAERRAITRAFMEQSAEATARFYSDEND